MIDKYFVNQSYKIYFCHRKEQKVIKLFSALRACFMELVYVSIFKRTPMAKYDLKNNLIDDLPPTAQNLSAFIEHDRSIETKFIQGTVPCGLLIVFFLLFFFFKLI